MLAAAASPANRPPTNPPKAKPQPPPQVYHKPVPAAVSTVSPDYTRLHIAPFDADLLSVVLPASIRPDARNISFHGLQTFPEKRYGFVDLPAEAAVKLRRKLNGAVLKGVKLSIETARQAPEDKFVEERKQQAEYAAKQAIEMAKRTEEEKQARREHKERKERKEKEKQEKKDKTRTSWDKLEDAKNKRQQLKGVQLDDRSVKRGWTEPETDEPETKRKYHTKEDKELAKKERKEKKEKKQREKSAYTDGPECLFKTILPANKVPAAKKDPVGSDGEVDERAAKRQRKAERKAREVVVHEFANWSRIPNFMKTAGETSAAAANLEYVDGKGWVAVGSGDVVEEIKSTRPNAVTAVITKEEQLAKRARYEARKAEAMKLAAGDDAEETKAASESETSDSGSDTSSDESSDEEEEKGGDDTLVAETEETSRPKSSSSAKSLTIKIPPPPQSESVTTSVSATVASSALTATDEPQTPAKVHPLEALYKRATQDKTETASEAKKPEATPFSFFGDVAGDDIEEDEDASAMQIDSTETETVAQPPMTPFSKQEFEWRNVRSAAPTPDTAHPSRKTFWAGEEDESEDDDEDEDEGDADGEPKKSDKNEATDFQSWFWDNRGDLNRSWKRRRKTAAKEKRYRENRARNERAI
ncbi:suppressor protein srp40 [Ophiostoma piceae UAMH 11346]|uniref:Suppressor protein srp40 n=1 Tax=Ophiostoma piceae (strain UAMH 11346) TaxID=1262450 RepID=S3CC59_OPHP1|nr:suppressor protein srp40 [Ophiostoma piceae UAMH 11346]